MNEFVDTHCHIQFDDYELDPEEVIKGAIADGVTRMLCVGCTLEDSKRAVEFAARHRSIWASIGIHPHEAKLYVDNDELLQEFRSLATKPRVVAVGEIGLDYYYRHSEPELQKEMLRFQLTLAQEHDLPVIFHVREAFPDFFAILDEFEGVRGVIHSFTGTKQELDEILSRGLSVGVNGIMTFTKNADQLEVAKAIPLNKLLLETDAPFLTPTPFRGTICQPKRVVNTAEFLSNLRGESLGELAVATTQNALALFRL